MTTWVNVPVRRIQPSVLLLQLAVESHGCYIAGGYARWACSRHDDTPPARDIDIICPNERKLQSLRAYFEQNAYVLLREGEYSFTYGHPSKHQESSALQKEIQLLKPYKGDSIQACLDQFDFGLCRVALTSHETAIADQRFVEDDKLCRVKVYHMKRGMEANTIQRLVRYAGKGFKVDKAEVSHALKFMTDALAAEVKKEVEQGKKQQESGWKSWLRNDGLS